MKKSNSFKSSKVLKTFEIGRSHLSMVAGGTTVVKFSSPYHIDGDDACSVSCPDARVDWKLV